MFESMKNGKGRRVRERSAWISTAALIHGGLLFAILAASVLARVEAGADPPEPLPPLSGIDVKLGDFPDAGPGPRPEPEKPREVVEPEPREMSDVQPVAPPEHTAVIFPEPAPTAPERDDVSGRSGDDIVGDSDRDGDGTGGGPPGTAGEPWGVPGGKNPTGPPSLAAPGDGPPVVSDPSTYGVEPPLLQARVEPEYPKIDILARLEGTVLLEALIGASGRVESIRVMAATNPRMQDAAVRAVQRWRYRPARQNGRTIGVFITIQVRFTLQ